jgi:hypothetical protein
MPIMRWTQTARPLWGKGRPRQNGSYSSKKIAPDEVAYGSRQSVHIQPTNVATSNG